MQKLGFGMMRLPMPNPKEQSKIDLELEEGHFVGEGESVSGMAVDQGIADGVFALAGMVHVGGVKVGIAAFQLLRLGGRARPIPEVLRDHPPPRKTSRGNGTR